MASPQAENGHIDLANEIVEHFYGLQLSGNQWRLLWVIIRQTYGWHKKTDQISITFFERKTGLDRRHIVRALRDMVERKIIAKNDTTYRTTYGFQKNYELWKLLPKKTHGKNGNGALPKMPLKPLPIMAHTKETINETEEKKRAGREMALSKDAIPCPHCKELRPLKEIIRFQMNGCTKCKEGVAC